METNLILAILAIIAGGCLAYLFLKSLRK